MNIACIMPWLDQLPNVDSTDFQERRNQIAEFVNEAEMLEKEAEAEAEELMSKAKALRAKAYFQSCTLEGDAKGKWSYEEIEQAKRCTG